MHDYSSAPRKSRYFPLDKNIAGCFQLIKLVHHAHAVAESVPVGIDVPEEIVACKAFAGAEKLKAVLPQVSLPQRGILVIDGGAGQKPLFGKVLFHGGEKFRIGLLLILLYLCGEQCVKLGCKLPLTGLVFQILLCDLLEV